MRRIFIIILVILLIISLLLAGSWIISRRKAVQNGGTPTSFRVFFGLGEKTPPGSSSGDGGLSPDTQGGNGGSSSNGTGGSGGTNTPSGDTSFNVAVSEFTSGPLTPSSGIGSGSSVVGNGSGTASGGIIGSGTIVPSQTGTQTGAGTGSSPAASAPSSSTTQTSSCRESDVTITFTPEEITRLNALQNRFYQVAQSLHTDSEVAAELANYNAFRAKSDQIGELNTYCQSKAPLIQSPSIYKARIATPFWRDAAKDVKGYLIAWPPASATSLYSENDSVVDPRDLAKGQSAFERILKLNLW